MNRGQKQPPSIPPYQGGSESGSSPDKGRRGRGCSLPDKGGRGEGLPVAPGRGEGSSFLPYNTNLTALARENRKNPTPAEFKLWKEVLRTRQFAGYKFLRQKPLGGYIADFYCSELQLVIEVDGDSHAESEEYDLERTKILNALGLQVIRYANRDIMRNIQGVYEDLLRKLGMIQT